jgi:hypothetical protein
LLAAMVGVMLRYVGVDTKKGGRGRLDAGGKTVQQGGRELQNKVRTSIAKVLGRAAWDHEELPFLHAAYCRLNGLDPSEVPEGTDYP